VSDRARWSRPVTFAALLLVALVTATIAAPRASAHDDLVGTAPVADAVVAVVPGEVTLTFVDPPLALGLAVVITGPDGVDVGAGSPSQTDSTVTRHIRPGSPAGVYTVRWRVTADDGHPTTGAFSFSSLAAGGSASDAAAGLDDSVGPSIRSRSSMLWLTTASTGLVLLAATAAAATVRRRVLAGPADLGDGPNDD
jgi:copper resistance protein C